jgi:hypothetical protein
MLYHPPLRAVIQLLQFRLLSLDSDTGSDVKSLKSRYLPLKYPFRFNKQWTNNKLFQVNL